jgi:hypothetical protein
MSQEVLLAPVPCVHLASAATIPKLKERIAFGTSQSAFKQQFESRIGIPVYIYASQPLHTSHPPHPLFCGPVASWKGELFAIVKANNRGKHDDPSIRPPSTLEKEDPDGPFLFFWEVEGLHRLKKPYLSLSKFKWKGGVGVPQWPALADLDV